MRSFCSANVELKRAENTSDTTLAGLNTGASEIWMFLRAPPSTFVFKPMRSAAA